MREKLKSAVDRANSFENELDMMREQVSTVAKLVQLFNLAFSMHAKILKKNAVSLDVSCQHAFQNRHHSTPQFYSAGKTVER